MSSALLVALTRSRLRSRLRGERGQAGLEGIIVFPIWLVVTTLFINLLFFLSSAMLVQANVNRAALQAAGLGCVTTGGSNSLTTELKDKRGLGIAPDSVRVRAGTLNTAPPGPGEASNYYVTNSRTFIDANGTMQSGLADATCTQPDAVLNGGYIFLQVTYKQNLWLFGSREVSRNALVISNALQRP